MTTRIVLASVGAGKTNTALNTLVDTLDTYPFAKVWALLASKRQEDAFRERLIGWRDDRQVYFNVEFFNFYELYQRLLDMNGQPQRDMSDTARMRILRSVIQDVQKTQGLRVFDGIAHFPGFIRIMANFIFELKQNLIYPDDFLQAVSTDRDRDIGLIYAGYQHRLQANNLVDVEGQGWLATVALRENGHLADDIALLLVDGFDQFTQVQAELLALLADRAEETLITLTTLPGIDNPASTRFDRTLSQLQEQFEEGHVDVVTLSHGSDERHTDLQHLVDNAFLPNAQVKAPEPDSNAIVMLEAPDPTREVGAVLRRVKRLLINTDNNPDDILIVLRNWDRYDTHFINLAQKYQLPLALHYGQALGENPVITAILNLLQLSERDFRRRDVLDVMRSPYFKIPALTNDKITLLEQISQQATVTRGRTQWEEAIQSAWISRVGDEDHESDDAPLLSQEDAENLYYDVVEFFNWIEPESQATIAEYVEWIEQLLGQDSNAHPDDGEAYEVEQGGFTLDVIAMIRDINTQDQIVARDLSALQAFKRVLKDMLTAQELLESLGQYDERVIDWSMFLTDLLNAVGTASINPRPNRSGRVLVTSATDARGLAHKHVFILGLSEGLFPAPTPEDPLYLDTERQRLRDDNQNNIRLQTQAERAADDGLFYELICLPQESLTLSRPTVQEGKVWIESHLWRTVTSVFADSAQIVAKNRIAIGQVVPVHDVASLDEAVIAVSDGLLYAPDDHHIELPTLYNWLVDEQTHYWGHVQHNRKVEVGRMSPLPFNRYSGRLQSQPLIDYVRDKLSPKRVWSASRLNDMGACHFKFFAKHLLKLEALEDPEEGMDVLQRGTLYHAILEKTYRRLQREDKAIIPDNLEYAQDILMQVAQAEFANAPDELGFRADSTWTQEQTLILESLLALIRKDFSESKRDNPMIKHFGATPRVPYRFEQAFGFGQDSAVVIDLGDDDGELRLRGFIDRIDRQGDKLIVMDYKSGSAKIPTREIAEGRNFQMMVYMLAAQQLLNEQMTVAGGVFWHISNQSTSGVLLLDDEASQDAIDAGLTHIKTYLREARDGDFSVAPKRLDEGKCVRYCEFYQLCRISTTNRFKGRGESNTD